VDSASAVEADLIVTGKHDSISVHLRCPSASPHECPTSYESQPERTRVSIFLLMRGLPLRSSPGRLPLRYSASADAQRLSRKFSAMIGQISGPNLGPAVMDAVNKCGVRANRSVLDRRIRR
jgi:hypothetical protein